MFNLLLLAVAPVIILLFYIYYRDKYEKESFGLLIKAIISGWIIVIPIIFIERAISNSFSPNSMFEMAMFDAFAVASFTEELFKWLAVMLLFYSSKHFNERFDGIVYASFVSLGFASVENVLYVVGNESYQVGLLRAFTAVPAHALFGVVMGYRLGLARFLPTNKGWHLFMSFFMPFMLHGIYDFLIMIEQGWALALFFPFVAFLWYFGLVRMKRHQLNSVFANKTTQL